MAKHHAYPCNLGYAVVAGIGDDVEQCLDSVAADRCDDAELGKVRAYPPIDSDLA
jgi:hypothetical protein